MAMNSQILSKEQVLIVGCGDIGARFAKVLPEQLYQVTGLRRSECPDLPYLRYQVCDVTDEGYLAEIIRQGEFAVILVSMTPAERSDAGYKRAYVQTCQNLLACLKRYARRPRLVMFISSTAVYGQDDDAFVDEYSSTRPESFSGQRLLEAEELLRNSGFPNLIARFSGIYGPGRNRLLNLVRQGRASLSPHITNRIHADDGAAALAHLVELSRAGVPLQNIYIVSDSAPAPLAEVNHWLARHMNIGLETVPEDAKERGNKRCSNKLLLATGFQLRYPDYIAGYTALLEAETQEGQVHI
ncbi:MAG TPA: NAD-dependent epimerase/dehydratase family protein [Cellvibrio sp.]|nr:NAD-dependent epimerase/dehydratase family protein [Cellvibrio sp.]